MDRFTTHFKPKTNSNSNSTKCASTAGFATTKDVTQFWRHRAFNCRSRRCVETVYLVRL